MHEGGTIFKLHACSCLIKHALVHPCLIFQPSNRLIAAAVSGLEAAEGLTDGQMPSPPRREAREKELREAYQQMGECLGRCQPCSSCGSLRSTVVEMRLCYTALYLSCSLSHNTVFELRLITQDRV